MSTVVHPGWELWTDSTITTCGREIGWGYFCYVFPYHETEHLTWLPANEGCPQMRDVWWGAVDRLLGRVKSHNLAVRDDQILAILIASMLSQYCLPISLSTAPYLAFHSWGTNTLAQKPIKSTSLIYTHSFTGSPLSREAKWGAVIPRSN